MTTGTEKHIARLKAELRPFKEALRRYAVGTPERRATQDRVDEIERDIKLFSSGKYSRKPW